MSEKRYKGIKNNWQLIETQEEIIKNQDMQIELLKDASVLLQKTVAMYENMFYGLFFAAIIFLPLTIGLLVWVLSR